MDPIGKRFPRAAAFALLLLLLFPLAGCRAPSGTTAGSGERRAAPPDAPTASSVEGRGEEPGADYPVFYVNGWENKTEDGRPAVTLIRSAGELSARYRETFRLYGELPDRDGGLDASARYGDAYFADHVLLIVSLAEPSGSVRLRVRELLPGERTTVHIDVLDPGGGTCDMAYWDVLIELPEGAAPPSEENVEVLLGERQLLELSDGAYGSFSVALPQNWVGTPERGGSGSSSLSLTVRRRDEPEGGAFRICYSRGFGVCGTGLRTEETRVAGYPARMGVYDGGAVWDFIVFSDTPPGAYWIDRSFSAAWWEKNREEVLSILSTLEIGEPGILREGEITALAEAEATKKYVRASALFDFDAACWTVRLSDPLSAAGDELFSFDASGRRLPR